MGVPDATTRLPPLDTDVGAWKSRNGYSVPPPTGRALSFRLCESKTRLFVLTPPGPDQRRGVLHIERGSKELVFWEEANSDLRPERLTSITSSGEPDLVFYGIMGFIRLLTSYYMVIITHRRSCSHPCL
jgi:hypothetical protein